MQNIFRHDNISEPTFTYRIGEFVSGKFFRALPGKDGISWLRKQY
jgi:hypothetical protein